MQYMLQISGYPVNFTRFCIWTELSLPIRVSNISQIQKLRVSSSLSSSSLSLYFITIIVIIIGVLSFILDCATVKDSLSDHNGSPFRTRDKVNKHCTHKMFGGWWYINNTDCAVSSNLNGAHHCKKRKRNMNETLGELKIHWGMLSDTDASHTSPLTSEMKIKPVDLPFKC